LLCLPACSNSYAGISLSAGEADPALQSLARRARAGDEHAQLDLGARYEDGDGVPRDLRRAEQLYRRASSPRSATQHIHSPAVGKHGQDRVVVSTGLPKPGLEEARVRLKGLQERAATAANRQGAGSNLSYSLGDVVQAPPMITSGLSRGEVWRRMIDRIAIEPRPLSLEDVARILGVPASAVRQSVDSIWNLRFAGEEGTEEFAFRVALRPCPKKPYRFVDLCVEGASIIELTITQFVSSSSSKPECPTTREVSARLVQAGWREPASAPASGDARSVPLDANDRDFDILVRPKAEIYIQPSTTMASGCITLINYYGFIADKGK
jgi:hypothetical protein